jgi:hypothetical protein
VTERRRDPYAILGVPRSASREEIARAYRARAKLAHPDVSGHPSLEMQELNWARNLLSDARRRGEWDRQHAGRTSAGHWAEPEPRVQPPPPWQTPHANPAWTVSGEPWAGAGAPAVQRRAGIGCLALSLLALVLSGSVLVGGFLSGYESPGDEPAQASEAAPAE